MADVAVYTSASSNTHTVGLYGPFWKDEDNGYIVSVASGGSGQVLLITTDDGGATWTTTGGFVSSSTVVEMAAWYDRQTPGDVGSKIHITWMEQTADEVYYRSYDVSASSFSSEVTVATGLTVGSTSGTEMTITKTVGGNLLIAYDTDNEYAIMRSTNGGSSWAARTADVFEATTDTDFTLALPANTGDDNDAAFLFWDRSADQITIKMYDDSADSVTESSIATAIETSYPSWAASVRKSDDKILLAFFNDHDVSTADIETYEITADSISSPTITAKTNVVSNQGESAAVAICIDQTTDDVYVAYGKGGTWASALDVVYHKSTDDMSTWGSELAYSEGTSDDIRWVASPSTIDSIGGRVQWAFFNDDINDIFVNTNNDVEIAAAALGAAMNHISASATAHNMTTSAGAVDVSMNHLDSSAALYQMTATPPPSAITMNAISASTSLFSMTVVPVQQVSMNAIASGISMHQMSIAMGPATVTMAHLDSSATVHDMTVSAGAVPVSMNTISSTLTIHEMSLAYSIELATVAASTTLYQMDVVPGSAQITMQHLSATTTLYDHTINTGPVGATMQHVSSGTALYEMFVAYSIVMGTVSSSTSLYQMTVIKGTIRDAIGPTIVMLNNDEIIAM